MRIKEHERVIRERQAELQQQQALHLLSLKQQREEMLMSYTKGVEKLHIQKEQKFKETEEKMRLLHQKHEQVMTERELQHKFMQEEKEHELARLHATAKESKQKFELDLRVQDAELRQEELKQEEEEKKGMDMLQHALMEEEMELTLNLEKQQKELEKEFKEKCEAMKQTAEEAFTDRVTIQVELENADGSILTISDTSEAGLAAQVARKHGLLVDDLFPEPEPDNK